MRLAVFSDVHGNIRNWKRFLELLPDLGVDEVACCGDLTGSEKNTLEIMEELDARHCSLWVLGNNDGYYLENFCWAAPHLAPRLRALRPFLEAEREGLRLQIMHGSPANHLHGRLYQEDLASYAYTGGADIVLTGHTHCRMAGFAGNTLFLNPGSLGQPRDGNPPGFALLDLAQRAVEFVRIDQL